MGSKKTKSEILKLKKFKRDASKRIKIDKIILFGSRAKGTSNEKSDYDLIIISEDFKNIPWGKRSSEIIPFWDFNEFKTGADFFCYTKEEFEEKIKGINVARIAAKEGVVV